LPLLSQLAERSFDTARAQIEQGRGVGRDAIERYLERRLPTGKIQTVLATIKASALRLGLQPAS
jgi:hypothetical protein